MIINNNSNIHIKVIQKSRTIYENYQSLKNITKRGISWLQAGSFNKFVRTETLNFLEK